MKFMLGYRNGRFLLTIFLVIMELPIQPQWGCGGCCEYAYRIKEYYYDSRKEQFRRTDEEHYQQLENWRKDTPSKRLWLTPLLAVLLSAYGGTENSR